MNIEDLAKLLESTGQNAGAEPNYVELRTPLKADGLWYIAYHWMHHDGTICEQQFTGVNLEELIKTMHAWINSNGLPTS